MLYWAAKFYFCANLQTWSKNYNTTMLYREHCLRAIGSLLPCYLCQVSHMQCPWHLFVAQPVFLWYEVPTNDSEHGDRTKDNASLSNNGQFNWATSRQKGHTKLKLLAYTGKLNGDIITCRMQFHQNPSEELNNKAKDILWTRGHWTIQHEHRTPWQIFPGGNERTGSDWGLSSDEAMGSSRMQRWGGRR